MRVTVRLLVLCCLLPGALQAADNDRARIAAERKAMAMALVDRALQAEELGEPVAAPAQDIEFVLYHSDNVEASGFVQHLKLPHYVDFQSELELVRRLRREYQGRQECSGEPE